MILPQTRDKRFITLRRGGSLSDQDHHALAVWAARCAERRTRRVVVANRAGSSLLEGVGFGGPKEPELDLLERVCARVRAPQENP